MGRAAVRTSVRPTSYGRVGNQNRYDRVEATVDAFEFIVTTNPHVRNARIRAHRALLRIGHKIDQKYKQPKSSRSCIKGGVLIRFTYVVFTRSKEALFAPRLMETKILGYGRNDKAVFSRLKKGMQHGNFGFSPKDYQVVYRYLWIPQHDIDSGKWRKSL